jgi:uncharacterized protein YcbX
MTGRVAEIWRHPIKAHGRETLDAVTLVAGTTMPGDRVWAVAHEASTADGSQWAVTGNFSRGVTAPQLQAIRARLDGGRVMLSHPGRPDLDIDPDTEGDLLVAWARPLMPPDRRQSARVIRVPGRGMTDTDFPSISILNAASNRAVGAQLGFEISPERWRGNFLIEGLEPWAEATWVGRSLALGAARLEVREPIVRCNATKVNTRTGEVDADTLGALKAGWGHQEFGVYAVVVEGGRVARGDDLRLIG